jgi:hypothetical protein
LRNSLYSDSIKDYLKAENIQSWFKKLINKIL